MNYTQTLCTPALHDVHLTCMTDCMCAQQYLDTEVMLKNTWLHYIAKYDHGICKKKYFTGFLTADFTFLTHFWSLYEMKNEVSSPQDLTSVQQVQFITLNMNMFL